MARPQPDSFMPAAEAAGRLGISLNTVKRRVQARILAGYRDPVNSRYQVSEKAVEDALELRAALRRSAMLPGATPLRKERIARPVAVQRR